MIKSALTILVALALAGTASAGMVNFGLLGISTPDITDASFTLDNVIFLYDTLGVAGNGSAVLTQFGVDITPGASGVTGSLSMQLPGPMLGGFSFDFSVLSLGTALGDPVFLTLLPTGDSFFSTANAGGNGSVAGYGATGSYNLANVDAALDTGAVDLLISNVNYDVVPEPGTYALLGAGLALLVVGRRKLAGRKA